MQHLPSDLFLILRSVLIYRADSSEYSRQRSVLHSAQCSIRRGSERTDRVLGDCSVEHSCALAGLEKLFSAAFTHYLLIHFTQPAVIMHATVNGYLSASHLFDNKHKWGRR